MREGCVFVFATRHPPHILPCPSNPELAWHTVTTVITQTCHNNCHFIKALSLESISSSKCIHCMSSLSLNLIRKNTRVHQGCNSVKGSHWGGSINIDDGGDWLDNSSSYVNTLTCIFSLILSRSIQEVNENRRKLWEYSLYSLFLTIQSWSSTWPT